MSKYVKLSIAVIISGLGLVLAFRGVEVDKLVMAIQQVNGWYILASMVLMVGSVVLRARRWQMILEPLKKIKLHPLFASTMIGYFGNSVLPFRLGELLRAFSIGKIQNISTSAAFGTIVLERIMDMLGVLIVMLVFFVLYPFPAWLKLSGLIAGALTASLILGLIILSFVKSALLDTIFEWRMFKTRLGDKLRQIIENLVEGLISLKSTSHLTGVVLYTVAMWIVYYICTYLVVLSVDVEVNWIAVGVTLVATTLAITIPAAPGYIGTYHAVAVMVMVELFNVALPEAQAFAVLVHAIGFVPYAIIGALYFLHHSIRLKDLQNAQQQI